MGSSSKKRQTMAKLNRERAVKEKRARKQEKKDERKAAAAAAASGEIPREGEFGTTESEFGGPESEFVAPVVDDENRVA
jgi:hypothetical protein